MQPREIQAVSALSVFLTAALPAAAGAIAFRAQPVLVAAVTGEPGQLPPLTGLYFNHFTAVLVTHALLAAGATWLALRAHRRADSTEVRLGTLLATMCFSAVLSVAFLALLVLATALPLYASLTAR
jgi:hypothetical protein